MKKTFQVMAMSLTIFLVISLGFALLYFFIPAKENYKPSKCLTDAINDTMSMREISIEYEKACVAVVSESTYRNGLNGAMSITSLGSGVCVASIGYQTKTGYTVSKGSYFVTNYHVVKYACDKDFQTTYKTEISLTVDDGNYNFYPANILWASKELDMAIIYTEKQIDGLAYVNMLDRTIDCDDSIRLRRDDVFTQGTPLDLEFLNTYAEGYISNSKTMESVATKDFYYSGSTGKITGSSNKLAMSGMYSKTIVDENVYENLIMMNLDITNGNSGGGLFDRQGNLVGLTTLGLDVDNTNGASMNFAVPIYPATLILDKLIENNEIENRYNIFSYQSLGLSVFDATMASSALSAQEIENAPFYYVDGKVLQSYDRNKLEFEREGVYVLSNSSASLNFLGEGAIITRAQNSKGVKEIKNRNDFIYFLLNCERNEKISISYLKSKTSLFETTAKDIVIA